LHLPGGGPIVSSPLSSTLIYGQRDAVLVDPPFTREQTVRVGDWIERSGKHLAYVYFTHEHGDHWFGRAQLLERFPGAAVYATEGTIRLMHQQPTKGREQTWDKDFPGLIPESPVLAHPIPPKDSNWRATSSRRSRPSTPTPTAVRREAKPARILRPDDRPLPRPAQQRPGVVLRSRTAQLITGYSIVPRVRAGASRPFDDDGVHADGFGRPFANDRATFSTMRNRAAPLIMRS
jgi:hypothetical protein